MSEWPLVIFTLALQFACGLVLAATLWDRQAVPANGAMRPLALAILPLAAAGLFASLFHLGRPISAWKSVLNLGSSRLSLEILITLLFVAAASVYAYAWWSERVEHRLALGIVTGLLALAAVVSSAAIYLIPTQPAWNSGWVPVSFLGTALLLGGTAAAVFLDLDVAGKACDWFLGSAFVGSLMLIAAAVWMVLTLSRGSADSYAAAQLQGALRVFTSRFVVWFVLYLLLAGILPIVVSVTLWMGRNHAAIRLGLRLLLFLAVASGAVIGRRIMYLLVTSRSQF